MVWILKIEDVDAGDVTIYAFQSRSDAHMEACAQLQDMIQNRWDMTDVDMASSAKAINTYISNQEYDRAVRYWNDCEFNVDSNRPYYFWVNEEVVGSPTQPDVFDDSFFVALEDDEEEEEEEEEDDSVSTDNLEDGDGFVPTKSGATCRGGHQEWNEYAYADRCDGTYLCRSCRMMRQVFGGAKKP